MNNYHRIYACISLDAIKNNVIQIKNALSAGTMIMPVIKADAYGHGAVRVAQAINDFTDGFGVATIEEALELRQNGIEKPILILGALSFNHYEEAVKNDITVNVFTEDMAKKLSAQARSLGKKAKINIALDTGMNRIGVRCDDEGFDIFKKIVSYPELEFGGVFSHFATADEQSKESALMQRRKFDDFCARAQEEGIYIPVKHLNNSAGICDFGDIPYSMVRPGIILYGLYPSDEVSKDIMLTPAMELKSHISHIKRVPSGEGISYGLTYVTNDERVIATVPVGYADGYPRLLSNKGRVIIKGKYAPIVGRICMDQFMVDITDIKGVNVEDTVTLMGKDGDAFIGADEIAALAGTISYEIVCGVSKRVPRVYI